MDLQNLLKGEHVLLGGYALVLIMLFLITITLVWRLIGALSSGDVPRIESHWGGIGGGLGGWEFSRAMVYLLASVCFAVLMVAVLHYAADDLRTPPRPPDNQGQQPPVDNKESLKPPADNKGQSQGSDSKDQPPSSGNKPQLETENPKADKS
jgi:hypothetical protein